MARKRSKENQGLPARWRLVHNAYYYQVPPGLEHLWDGKDPRELERLDTSEYICFAILSAARNSSNERANYGIYFQCRRVIEQRLFPNNCLETWLWRSGNVPLKEITHKRLQAHRLAWMDVLIKEFKAKGD